MWIYEKKLQYPVRIKNRNPRMAKYIISQFGGPDGELAASLRYLSQRYSMPDGVSKGVLTDVGIEDLFCAFIKVFVFPPLERTLSALFTPFVLYSQRTKGLKLNLMFRFKRSVLLFLLCLVLCSIFDLIFKSANGSGAEWSEADDRVSPCKKQGKTLSSETVCFRFRSVRIVV